MTPVACTIVGDEMSGMAEFEAPPAGEVVLDIPDGWTVVAHAGYLPLGGNRYRVAVRRTVRELAPYERKEGAP